MPGPWSTRRIAALAWLPVGLLGFVGLVAGSWSTPALAQQAGACLTEVEPNERPETSQDVTGDVCIQGDLAQLTDQDLFLWDMPAVDALHTWTFTIDGVPTTITSIRLFRVTSPPGDAPVVDHQELLRVDSSATDRTPGVMAGVTLAAGRYLLGISRGAPARGGDLPTGPYMARVEAQGVVPPVGDIEPNDDPGSATPLAAAFELSGDAAGSPDTFAWTIAAGDAATSWDVWTHMPFASQATSTVSVATPDGRVLSTAPIDAHGEARIYDLRLPAGTYLVQIPGATSSQPYVLASSVSTGDSSDPEPDDTPATAVVLDPGAGPVHGRLAVDRDSDFYQLPVDAALAATQFDVALSWASGPSRQLCLYRDLNTLIQCADGGVQAAVLSNLRLPAGQYTLQVIGDESPADGYALAIEDVGPPRADREVEPNDDGITASPFAAGVAMSGRADASDDDVYRVTVGGERSEAWRLDATGSGLELLEWVGRDGSVLASGELSGDLTHASLWDLYLVPGDHWIHVRASGGPYQLALTPAGPVGGDGEREPNDSLLTAQTMPVDGTRTGRLPAASDTDVFRFSLRANEHVAIHLDPPADAAVELELTSGGATLASFRDPVAGAPVIHDSLLWPGDYEISLRSGSRSVSPYTLRLERLDPFATPSASQPPSISPTPAELSPLTLELRPAATEVAAWSELGQRVTGELVVTSAAPAGTHVVLDTAVSDHAWSMETGSHAIDIPPSGRVVVPLTIHVPADAPADVPVRITVRATAPDGAWTTSYTELVPQRDTPLVDAYQAWPVPDALLGGLDAASLAVGGMPRDSSDPTKEALLHDGVALTGSGFSAPLVDGALTMSVDLAGDEPVQVAGTIVNSLAFDGQFQYRPRDFEFLLSDDGVTWRSALTGQLSPMSTDQSFVLPQPIAARFARLRITSTYGSAVFGGPVTYAPLGEWKVVVQPGTDVSAAPVNIADPARDGHVVWMDPQPPHEGYVAGMLSEDPTPWSLDIAHSRPPQFVVGFHDDRTAQVTELQWVDPPGSTPETRPVRVTLDVSLDSPMGPWQPVGAWQLDRAADGSVTPFTFPAPTWARFIRFVPDPPTTPVSTWEMPSTLRVLERVTDAQYRSILGEWGMGSPQGIHEVLVPPVAATSDDTTDDDNGPQTARPLLVGETAWGSVHRGQDEDWYVIQMPAVHDELTLDIEGRGYVDAGVELYDDSGALVPVVESEGRTAAFLRVRAQVVPGATYRLRVMQPPFSVVITYDTSGSLGPYLSYVGQALRSFAAGVTPGDEAVRITPFEDPSLLDDWSDDANALQAAVESQVLHAFSSGVEAGILEASKRLSDRIGTRAILVMTDGDTLSYNLREPMWERLGAARPVIFGVHVAGSGDPAATTHLMQDLSSTGGHYQYAASHGDIDGAFDRIATRLRGPAAYALSFSTAEVPKLPGTIGVRSDAGPVVIGGDVAVELVLDTSGSMTRKIGKKTRIAIARSVLGDLVTGTLPEGLPVAFRTFKAGGKDACGTVLAVPLGPLDRAALARRIAKVTIAKGTKTPLGATLRAVGDDLAGVTGPTVVVLVTDGQETCKGDPATEIEALLAQGLDVQVNIVGFAIDDAGLEADIARWAALGHGASFQADNAKDLGAAISRALAAPFRVHDASGAIVASGRVGGDPVSVPPGTYRVEVLTDPLLTFDSVVVRSGAGVDLVIAPDPASG